MLYVKNFANFLLACLGTFFYSFPYKDDVIEFPLFYFYVFLVILFVLILKLVINVFLNFQGALKKLSL